MTKIVFISFSSKDRKLAERIYDHLGKNGITCWISSRDVPPGADYQACIAQAIQDATLVLLVFSSDANNSAEIAKELSLASKKMLIPTRIEDVLPQGAFKYQLSNRQFIDLFEDFENRLHELTRLVQRTLNNNPEPSILSVSQCRPKNRFGLLHFSTIGLLVATMAVGGWFISHRNVSPSVEPVPGTAQPAKAARMSDAPFIATKSAPPAVLETPEAIPSPAIQTASQQPRNIEKISKSVPTVANQAAAQQAIALLGTLKTYERVAALKTIPIPDQISAATASDLLEGTGNQRADAIALIAPKLASNMVGSELALVLGETQTYSRVESIRSIERAGKISNNLSANDANVALDGTGNQRADAIALIAPQLVSNMGGSEHALVLGETQTYSRVESIRSLSRAGKISKSLSANEAILVLDDTGNQRADAIALIAPKLASNMVGSELALVLGETQTYSRVESIRSIERAGKISNNLSANEVILVLDGTGDQRADAIALIAPQLTSNMAGSELALVLGETQTYSRFESIRSIERAGKIKRGLTAEDVALVSAGLREQTASGLGVLAPYLAR